MKQPEDEAKKMYTMMRSFDAVEKAKKKLPWADEFPFPEIDIPMRIDVDTPEGSINVKIRFQRIKHNIWGWQWEYKSAGLL